MDLRDEMPLQFKYINLAKQKIVFWAENNNVKLDKIEFVVPFTVGNKSLIVWLFYLDNETLKKYKIDETYHKTKEVFFNILKELGYPKDYLDEVKFEVDSTENVKTNFEGKYFNRLR